MLFWLAFFFDSVFANWVTRPCVLSLRSKCFGGLLSSVVGDWLIVSGLLVFVVWLVLAVVCLVSVMSVRVVVCGSPFGCLVSSCLCVLLLVVCLLVRSGSFCGVS